MTPSIFCVFFFQVSITQLPLNFYTHLCFVTLSHIIANILLTNLNIVLTL